MLGTCSNCHRGAKRFAGFFMRWAYLCRMQSGDASRNGVAAQLCRVVPDREDCFAQIYSVVLVPCGFGMLD